VVVAIDAADGDAVGGVVGSVGGNAVLCSISCLIDGVMRCNQVTQRKRKKSMFVNFSMLSIRLTRPYPFGSAEPMSAIDAEPLELGSSSKSRAGKQYASSETRITDFRVVCDRFVSPISPNRVGLPPCRGTNECFGVHE
jgi:hypothetical protein